MTRRAVALAFVAIATMPGALCEAASSRDDLQQVVALYHSARFDEALSALDQLERGRGTTAEAPGDAERETASEVRALCLIALNRDDDARTVVQQMLERRIDYQPRSGDVPPRFAAMVSDSRSEVWRRLVREEYRAGKDSYEEEAYAAAEAHLLTVLRLMEERSIEPGVRRSLADVNDLAEEYLSLASAANLVPPLSPAPPRTADHSATIPGAIYSSADPGVTPPAAIAQEVPRWRNTGSEGQFFRRRETGVLEIVIDEQGRVETARLAKPVHPLYDPRLLAAAAAWRYHPATRDGRAVRYRKSIEIRLVD